MVFSSDLVKSKCLRVDGKRIVNSVFMVLLIVGAIADKPTVSFAATTQDVLTLDKSTFKPVSQNQAIYRSDRLRLQFNYSLPDFVVEDKTFSSGNNVNSPLLAIDIWTKNHAQKIRAGDYAGGTEYPANVHINVYNNPRKLTLQQWVKQSNQFSITRDFKPAKIARQTGIKFQSSGLYENEHVVFVNPRDSRIIVVTLSKTGYGNNDAIYRRAYQQIVNSFVFLNK
ncbi:hypothetical protein [Nostoc sp. TCL26-01]|uniref:hypothetical protein n=1 Tax=Nostoc sp. TCL26-01 TaxID=2576904 RepID=UPI0021177F86|nr:hypothetical protein [Nostoc sp. TCL26-01]QLE55205.1 hypothetical protein FD725_06580 [Nostoc sp. TCL26-01]